MENTALTDGPGTVRQLIDARAADSGDRAWLIDVESGNTIDHDSLRMAARALTDKVSALGVRQGESVAFAMHNGSACVETVLGLMYGGFRAVAINLVAGRDVIGYVLAHSQAVLIITQQEHAGLIDDALHCEAYRAEAENDDADGGHSADRKEPRLLLMEESLAAKRSDAQSGTQSYTRSDKLSGLWKETQPGTPAGQQSVARPGNKPHGDGDTAGADENRLGDVESAIINAESDALLMYTSGTTGRPKGVVLSHGNLIAGGCNVVDGHQLTPHDRALCVLPLYHINGLCVTVFGPLVSGGSVVLPRRFSTSGFWDWVDTFECTWFSVVPTQIAYLLRDASDYVDRPFLRFGRSASAPLSPDVHGSFEKRFGIPLIETMGLTETAAQILSNPMPPQERRLGSPGVPVGDDVRIVDAELNELDVDEEGELLVRGPNVMLRYFRNETATRDALLPDGWFRTGDLGRKDVDGFLFITGRLKELIIKGGENIAPREIDDALYQHADVVEAAAFARPCEQYGQRVEAAVCLRKDSRLDEAELLSLCEERVGRFKCPDRIHFLEELPKGPSGKIQRQKLLDVVTTASTAAASVE